MGLLVINDNLLTALGITNEDQFNQTFSDFRDFEDFLENADYTYKFDEDSNLILVTPKSKEIITGIKIQREEPVPTPDSSYHFYKYSLDANYNYTDGQLPKGYKFTLDTFNPVYYNLDGSDKYKKYNGEIIILDETNVFQYFSIDRLDISLSPKNDNHIIYINSINIREVSDEWEKQQAGGSDFIYDPNAIEPNNIIITNLNNGLSSQFMDWILTDPPVMNDFNQGFYATYTVVEENTDQEIEIDDSKFIAGGTLVGRKFTGEAISHIHDFEPDYEFDYSDQPLKQFHAIGTVEFTTKINLEPNN